MLLVSCFSYPFHWNVNRWIDYDIAMLTYGECDCDLIIVLLFAFSNNHTLNEIIVILSNCSSVSVIGKFCKSLRNFKVQTMFFLLVSCISV